MGMRRAGLAGGLLAAVIGTTAAVLSDAPALACSCAGGSVGRTPDVASTARIFTGTLTHLDDPDGGGPVVSSMREVTVHLAVETVYRGRVGAEELVRTAASSGSCGVAFEEGQRYTLFLDPPSSSDPPVVGMCGPTVHGGTDPAAVWPRLGDGPTGGSVEPAPHRPGDGGAGRSARRRAAAGPAHPAESGQWVTLPTPNWLPTAVTVVPTTSTSRRSSEGPSSATRW
jgi:hypothetical protein